jgi:methenyltetrahydrofolate cyclohydrolase
MRDEKIGEFLDRVADRVPAPGGGAPAAFQSALGAALLGMVARYSTGEQYAGHQEAIGRILAEADELRSIALRLAEADADALLAAESLHDHDGSSGSARTAGSAGPPSPAGPRSRSR